MKDPEGVRFLQEVLPRLHLRWPGFRKVRRQVYKRVDRRLHDLGLADLTEYSAYLEAHPEEWHVLDAACRIPISRFYRDRGVFQFLERQAIPDLAEQAVACGEEELRCWSLGCAAGEEPYTLAILWKLALQARFPTLSLRVLATDVDPEAIARAARACYSPSSLKELPAEWRAQALTPSAAGWCVNAEYREAVCFELQDIRATAPTEHFHAILCRYVVFTYFEDSLQRAVLQTLVDRLLPGGALVIGQGESLPVGFSNMGAWSTKMGVYRKAGEPAEP